MEPATEPFITVVIPTYDRPAALHRCLMSLVVQQYPRQALEIIVVDDGSEPPAASSLPTRLTHDIPLTLVRQPHQGVSVARAAGIASARGELLAFLDDDCTVAPDYLRSIDQLFRDYPATMVAQIGLENPQRKNLYAQAWKFALDRTVEMNLHVGEDGRVTCGILGGVMVARREIFETIAYDPALRRRQDADMRYQLQTANLPVYYEPQIRVFHHYRQNLRAYLKTFFDYGRAEVLLQQKWRLSQSPLRYPNLISAHALRSLVGMEGLVRGFEIYLLLVLKRHAGRWGMSYEKAYRFRPSERKSPSLRFICLLLMDYSSGAVLLCRAVAHEMGVHLRSRGVKQF